MTANIRNVLIALDLKDLGFSRDEIRGNLEANNSCPAMLFNIPTILETGIEYLKSEEGKRINARAYIANIFTEYYASKIVPD